MSILLGIGIFILICFIIDSHEIFEEAENIRTGALIEYNDAQDELEKRRKETKKCLENLGSRKIEIFTNQVNYIINMQKDFYDHNVDKNIFLENLNGLEHTLQKTKEIKYYQYP